MKLSVLMCFCLLATTATARAESWSCNFRVYGHDSQPTVARGTGSSKREAKLAAYARCMEKAGRDQCDNAWYISYGACVGVDKEPSALGRTLDKWLPVGD